MESSCQLRQGIVDGRGGVSNEANTMVGSVQGKGMPSGRGVLLCLKRVACTETMHDV